MTIDNAITIVGNTIRRNNLDKGEISEALMRLYQHKCDLAILRDKIDGILDTLDSYSGDMPYGAYADIWELVDGLIEDEKENDIV